MIFKPLHDELWITQDGLLDRRTRIRGMSPFRIQVGEDLFDHVEVLDARDESHRPIPTAPYAR